MEGMDPTRRFDRSKRRIGEMTDGKGLNDDLSMVRN